MEKVKPKELFMGHITVRMHSDGSGFIIKDRNSTGDVSFSIGVMQTIINEYNKYRNELKKNDQLHSDCVNIIPEKLDNTNYGY